MNGAIKVKDEEKAVDGKEARRFRDGSGTIFKHTAELNPFFEGVFRRYHNGNRSLYTIDPTGYGSIFDIIVPTYGNYCGPGWTGGERWPSNPKFGVPPIDALDSCCQRHDECYYICDNPDKVCSIKPVFPKSKECKLQCNRSLCSCSKGVADTNDSYHNVYNRGVQAVFCGK
jgi:hypothetical protein